MLKFIVISDTHIVPKDKTCNGLKSYERFKAAIKSINENHPDADFCIVAGDIVDKGDVESYKLFSNLIFDFKIPLYVTIGNHDNRDNFKKVFNDKFSDENGFIQNIIDKDNQRIIILDSNNENLLGEGKLCETRLNWLENKIKDKKNSKIIIVIHHHVQKINSPYIDLISLENAEIFNKILKKYKNIKHIIAGHVHISSNTTKDNIPQTTIGGSHYTHSVKNFFTPFKYQINDIKLMNSENQISRKMIEEMTEQYDKLIKLEGPAQYGVVLSNNDSTIIHFHNYIDKSDELPKSETQLEY